MFEKSIGKALFFICFTSFLLVSEAFAQRGRPKLKATVERAQRALKMVDGVVSPAPPPCLVDTDEPVPKAIPVANESVAEKISGELVAERALSPFMKTCFDSLDKIDAPKTFEEAIRLAIDFNLGPQENMFDESLGEVYDTGLKEDKENVTGFKWGTKAGLFTHKMCEKTDHYFIRRKENAKEDRIKNGEAKMKEFAKKYNALFNEYQKAIADKKEQAVLDAIQKRMKDFYFALLGSMALHESLGDANNGQQERLAEQFSESYGMEKGYVRPLGVKFYYDRAQSDEVSKQNIGLYQFTPKIGGNIDACYNAWNNTVGKKSAACKIDLQKSNKTSFEFIAASDQMFNAFCGANKLVQSFGVQVNAQHFNSPAGKVMQLTHSENKLKNEKLVEGKNRCISPFAYSRNAYMHFGVLGYTTYIEGADKKASSNTQEVLTSTLDALK
jgi:hypothetical protein